MPHKTQLKLNKSPDSLGAFIVRFCNNNARANLASRAPTQYISRQINWLILMHVAKGLWCGHALRHTHRGLGTRLGRNVSRIVLLEILYHAWQQGLWDVIAILNSGKFVDVFDPPTHLYPIR